MHSPAGGFGKIIGTEGGKIQIEGDDGQVLDVEANEARMVPEGTRAVLPGKPKLIEDPKGRLDSYLEWAKDQLGVTAAGEPPNTVTPGAQISPLFLAEVDPIDTSAVIALLAIFPDDTGGLRAFERKGGGWVESPSYVRDIQGLTPPALVELDRETLLAVVEQMDQYDVSQAGEAVGEPEYEELPVEPMGEAAVEEQI